MSIYLSSDHHFNHANIIKFCNRPYKDVVEMNEMLVLNWNKVVGPDDEVYYLGDFSLAASGVEQYARRLNGTKYLIPGNHDLCHPANKKGRKKPEESLKLYKRHGFIVLPIHYHMDIDGVGRVNMSHMPYKGDYTDERYPEYKLENEGDWLLCGHVHEKWWNKDRQINVGVDQWDYTPVSLECVVDHMKRMS